MRKMVYVIVVIIILILLFNITIGILNSNKNRLLQFSVINLSLKESKEYMSSLKRTGLFAADYRKSPENTFDEQKANEIINNPDRYKVIEISYEIYNKSSDLLYNDIFFVPDFDESISNCVLAYSTFFAYDKLNWPIEVNQTRNFRQHILVDLNNISENDFLEALKNQRINVEYRTEKQRQLPIQKHFWIKDTIYINF